jgi:hypothetical protein
MDEPAPPPILVPTLPAERPPVWPSLLAPFVASFAAIFASAVAIAGLHSLLGSSLTGFPTSAALLLSAQTAFLATAVFFASMTRERPSDRLGFVRWECSTWTVVLAVLGTLGVQFLIDLVAWSLIDEPSDALKRVSRMILDAQGFDAVALGFLVSVLPGACEETLFRGFTQRGLLRRWSPLAAIGLTSLLFAAIHADLQHSLLVLLLGAWIGFVAWRTGSVWPAILCHFVNNLVAFVFLRQWADPESFELPDEPVIYVVGSALVVCGVLAAVGLCRRQAAGAP